MLGQKGRELGKAETRGEGSSEVVGSTWELCHKMWHRQEGKWESSRELALVTLAKEVAKEGLTWVWELKSSELF